MAKFTFDRTRDTTSDGTSLDLTTPTPTSFRNTALHAGRLASKLVAAGRNAVDAFITTDFDALLVHPDVDLISITTPPALHADLTIRAAQAGKHVCLEKPLALDWESCLRMQKAVR